MSHWAANRDEYSQGTALPACLALFSDLPDHEWLTKFFWSDCTNSKMHLTSWSRLLPKQKRGKADVGDDQKNGRTGRTVRPFLFADLRCLRSNYEPAKVLESE